jgi:hypothetical protein
MPIDKKPPYGTPLKKDWHTQGLVGFWGMQEGGGQIVHDLSGKNNDGKMTNMDNPSSATSGWAGQGLRFDGVNDYVNVPHNANQLLTTGGTISVWINPAGYGEGNNGVFVHKSTTGQLSVDGYLFRINGNKGVTASINNGTLRASANNVIVLNTWQHLVATWDSTGLVTIYKNGVVTGTPGISAVPTGITATTSLAIGSDLTTDITFNGKLDDVRIYNRNLSAMEVWETFIRPNNIYESRRNTRYFAPWWSIYTDTLQDSLTIADSRSKQASIAKSDTLHLADSRSKEISIVNNDIISLAETFIKQLNIVKSDSLEITDIFIEHIDANLEDNIAFTDDFTAQENRVYFELLSDYIQLLDTTQKTVHISRNEDVGFADSINPGFGFTLSDNIHISDQIIQGNINVGKNDSVVFSDSHSDTILRDREVHIRLHIKKI